MDSTRHSLCFASQAFSCEANTTARFTILSISTLEHKFVACIINFFIYVCGQFVLISIKWIELARPIICTYVTTLSLSLSTPSHTCISCVSSFHFCELKSRTVVTCPLYSFIMSTAIICLLPLFWRVLH